jgi:hypothetical protein
MTFLPECPHCGRQEMTFYFVAQSYKVTFWICAHCGGGVCGVSEHEVRNNVFKYEYFEKIYPEPQPLDAPPHTPENINRVYKTSVRNLRSGMDSDYEATGIMARKVLEMAANEAGGKGGNLFQKISDLANRRVITQALAEWAHAIREIGNEAAHDDTPFTKEDAEQTTYFAEMFLTYLFTLPGMIAERRA